ncbi:hypothetical protein [Novacetimonas hansenii]|uniref:hypothetical protein n=1 Tax=Novacetimonas hansenii TaxID=436 RepID=UPI000AAEFCA6|nr:hypothetical protein [Novacetimonas hansenii]
MWELAEIYEIFGEAFSRRDQGSGHGADTRAAFAGIMGIFDNELKISDFSRGCLNSQTR